MAVASFTNSIQAGRAASALVNKLAVIVVANPNCTNQVGRVPNEPAIARGAGFACNRQLFETGFARRAVPLA